MPHNKESMLGKKLILWVLSDGHAPYTDQMGMVHKARVVTEEIPVTIIEVKRVPNRIVPGETFEALRAVSETGEEFTNSWNAGDSSDMHPWSDWRHGRDPIIRVAEACGIYNTKELGPLMRPDGTRAVPTGASRCNKHDKVFMPGDACLLCRVGAERTQG